MSVGMSADPTVNLSQSNDDPIDDFNFDSPPPSPANDGLSAGGSPPESAAPAAPARSAIPPAFPEQSTNRQGPPVAGPPNVPPGNTSGTSSAADSNAGDVVFPPELLRDAGMTEQQARAQFTDPSELRRFTDLINARLLQSAMAQRASAAPPQLQAPSVAPPGNFAPAVPPVQAPAGMGIPPQQQPPAQPGPAGQMQSQFPGVKRFELQLDPNQYEKQVLDAFNGLNDHYHGLAVAQQQQVDQLTNVLRQSLQYQVARQQEAYFDEFDRVLNSMEEYREIVGQGNRHTLDPATQHFQNRRQIEEFVGLLSQQRKAHGMRQLPLNEAVQAAIRVAFPQQHDTTVRNQVAGQVQRRQQQFTQPPSGRRALPPSGDAAAVAQVREILSRNNMPGQSAPIEDDSF